jgi:hypothetical protein
MKKTNGGPMTVAAIATAIAATLILTISYVYAKACPASGAVPLRLRLESVTVDGVPQEDLSIYYQHNLVSTTLMADVEHLKNVDGKGNFTVDQVILRFAGRVDNPGSYDEIYRLDPGNR